MSIDTMKLEQFRELSEIIFPDVSETPADLEAKYPTRSNMSKYRIGRFAPSPTGFIHIGGIFAALVNRMATLNGGTFMLRIEDTDQKREIEQGAEKIIETLDYLKLLPDEGPYTTDPIQERGNYGPYIQSRRFDIYQVFAKDVVARGLAYPCFMSDEELSAIRTEQTAKNIQTGIYGTWAYSRQLTFENIINRIKNNEKFVIRLKSNTTEGQRIYIKDLIRGDLDFPANALDAVLLKSDRFPTYHFAHVIDDLLMRVNLVLRGDEWISSLPLHIQLHNLIQASLPEYAHFGPIAKMDGASRRKLSKRKDPEAAMSYYYEKGYPNQVVIEYLLNLANSSFEEWRVEHPNASYLEFPFDITQLGKSSMLFDINKLDNISKDVIASYKAEEVYSHMIDWSNTYYPALLPILQEDSEYSCRVLNIGRTGDALRKDLTKWGDFEEQYGFFFDGFFDLSVRDGYGEMPKLASQNINEVLNYLIKTLSSFDLEDKDTWFNRLRQYASDNNYAARRKDFEKNPSQYKGWFGDIVMIFRVAITGKTSTPDLHEIIQLMGLKRVERRLEKAKDYFLSKM